MAKEAGQRGYGRAGVIHESDLKLCDLCGSLNLAINTECFVCGWHSYFERRPEVIRAAIEIAVRRYGRLELQHLTDVCTFQECAPPTFGGRLYGWLHSMWVWLSE